MAKTSLLLICLPLLAALCCCSQIPCEDDSVCRASFHEKYFCETESQTCRRLPFSREFGLKNAFGLFIVFIINAFTVSFGVSGSGPLYASIISLLDFTTKDAIPMYKISNFVGAMTSVGFILTRRKEEDLNTLLVDWKVLAFSLSLMFAGSIVGVLFADFLSGVVISLFVLLSLLYVLYSLYVYLQNETNRIQHTIDIHPDAPPKLARVYGYENDRSLFELIWRQIRAIITVLFAFLISNLTVYAQGPASSDLFWHIMPCSSLSLATMVLAVVSCAALGAAYILDIRDRFGLQQAKLLAIKAFLAGIVTTVGISGSVFYTSALLSAGVEAQTTAAVSSVALFLSSLGTILQFAYMGYFDLFNAIIIAIVSLIGSLAGNALFKGKSLHKKAQKILPEIVLAITVLTILGLVPLVWYEYDSNNNFTKFGSFCK